MRQYALAALAALANLRQLDDAMAQRRGLRKGRVELAIVSTAKYFVPMLLVTFRKKFPDMEVALQIHNRDNIMKLLANNEVDLVIMGHTPAAMDCEATAFATNPMAVLSAPSHPLSRRRGRRFRCWPSMNSSCASRGRARAN